MNTNRVPDCHDEILKVWAEDLAQIAYLHAAEPTAELLKSLREIDFPCNLGIALKLPESLTALDLFHDGLKVLPNPADAATLDELAVDFADIYLNHTIGASPLESVWIDEDRLALQEPTFQVRAFYRRHLLKAKNWRLRSDDHLVSELEFVAHLLNSGMSEVDELGRFLDQHLLRWLPDFAVRVAQRASTDFFRGLSVLTAAYVEELRAYLEELSGVKRPDKKSIDQLMKPPHLVKIGSSKYVPGAEPSW